MEPDSLTILDVSPGFKAEAKVYSFQPIPCRVTVKHHGQTVHEGQLQAQIWCNIVDAVSPSGRWHAVHLEPTPRKLSGDYSTELCDSRRDANCGPGFTRNSEHVVFEGFIIPLSPGSYELTARVRFSPIVDRYLREEMVDWPATYPEEVRAQVG